MDYAAYIRNHITDLRIEKNVSEYEMSLALGMNRNYIQGITSGKALPSMAQFLSICDYFHITPMQFFDGDELYPQLVRQVMDELCLLNEADLHLLLTIIHHLRCGHA